MYLIIKYLTHCLKIKANKVCKVNRFYGIDRNKTVTCPNYGFILRVKDGYN